MSQLLDSYRRNAEEARAEAERATLPNVRARALEASVRWTEMAERLERVEEQSQIRLSEVVTRPKVDDDGRSPHIRPRLGLHSVELRRKR